jgi:hypothetical protein
MAKCESTFKSKECSSPPAKGMASPKGTVPHLGSTDSFITLVLQKGFSYTILNMLYNYKV